MAKNEIRLQYSGFIIFAAKMLSVATGLIFQLMIARGVRLYSVAVDWKFEYDLWFNLTDILAYFTLLAAAFPFWTMRFVARGKEEAVKTGIVGNLIISAIATAIYILLVPFITSSLGIPQEYLLLYFLISVQIIELYSINALEACLRAKIPHTIGYGLLILEASKVALGYLLIWELKQPLLGALLSLLIAFTIQIAYYFKLLAGELKTRVNWKYMKEWVKGSTANVYNVVGYRIATFIFMMLFMYGGPGALSRYGLATQIANVIAYSSFLAFALYPRLLAEKNRGDITTSLKMVLMFAIPMTAGAIALSDSYMIIMQSEYRDASLVLTVLAIDAFVITISTLFATVLYGTESVDERTKISFRELIKSRLFIAFSLPYFHSAITLPTTFFVLTNFAQDQPLPSAIYVSIINASARLVMFLVLYVIIRRMVKIDIPWKSIAKYVFASAVMASVLFIAPHPTRIYLTLIETAIAGIVYVALLMVIDKEARMLVYSVWHEIRLKVERVIT